MRQIPLSQGLFATVDDEDYEMLMQGWGWSAQKDRHTYYAVRSLSPINGKKRAEKMHRVILSAPKGVLVDHIDGNGLNNCRTNIRLVTVAQNNHRARLMSNNTSGYKGVVLCQGKWMARIGFQRTRIQIGMFDTKEEAAKAYDEAARKYFGEFARLNFG